MAKHTVCKAGAAVRLHGYAPARVLSLEYAPDYSMGSWLAHCVITGRGPDWKAGRIGPHGYRTGEKVTVRIHDAVPRDIIRQSRKYSGALRWPSFSIEATQ